jgi:hypothetical protein
MNNGINSKNDLQDIVLTQELNVLNNQSCNQEPQIIDNGDEENESKGSWRGGLFACCFKCQ